MLSIDNEKTQSLSDIGLSWLPEFQPGIPDQFQPYKYGSYLLFARTVDKHSYVWGADEDLWIKEKIKELSQLI